MLSLLRANNRTPLFHMSKSFIWIEETKGRIDEFSIGYMINPKLNINKAFREEVLKYMNTKFGQINQPHIRTTLTKNTTRVLALLMFYETRKYPKKSFEVFSCVIHTIISNYVCINYLAFQSKN